MGKFYYVTFMLMPLLIGPEIKEVKKRKERAKELEGIDLSNIVSNTRRRSTTSFVPPPRPKLPPKEDKNDDKKDDSSNDDASDGDKDDDDDEDDDSSQSEEFNEGIFASIYILQWWFADLRCFYLLGISFLVQLSFPVFSFLLNTGLLDALLVACFCAAITAIFLFLWLKFHNGNIPLLSKFQNFVCTGHVRRLSLLAYVDNFR